MLSWALLGTAVFIFCARVVDVSLGTLRIVLVSRGMRHVAPLVGFFEVLVWLSAVGQVIQHIQQPLHYVAFAGGFATGTWCGMVLEERLALGLVAVRIITGEDAERLIAELGHHQFGLTTFAARGLKGRVRLILTIIRRKDLGQVLETVEREHPLAFVSVSDVRAAREGFLVGSGSRRRALEWMRKK